MKIVSINTLFLISKTQVVGVALKSFKSFIFSISFTGEIMKTVKRLVIKLPPVLFKENKKNYVHAINVEVFYLIKSL